MHTDTCASSRASSRTSIALRESVAECLPASRRSRFRFALALTVSSVFLLSQGVLAAGDTNAAPETTAARQEVPADGADSDQARTAPPERASGRESARDDVRTGGREGRAGRGMPLPPDWPRAGGFGPGSEGRESPLLEGLVVGEMMAEGEFAQRELTEADLARVVSVARRVSEEWGSAIEARLAENPAQAKQFLRTGGRRLMALVALEVRAPKVFEAKVVELRAQGETARAAQALLRAETAGAPDAEQSALREAFDRAVRAQIDASFATRAEELTAIESRVARLREELASDRSNSASAADEVRERAQKVARDRASRVERAPTRSESAPTRSESAPTRSESAPTHDPAPR